MGTALFSNGSQILNTCEMEECARALAIMAYKFEPDQPYSTQV